MHCDARLSLPARYVQHMRFPLALLLFAAPAAAWEFAPAPVCTLTNADKTVTLTYDPALPEYTITLTLPQGRWAQADAFSMAFRGARALVIGTDRHQLSADGRSLTVTDRGFGNVLDGLEFNRDALAASGDVTLGIDLAGINPAITAFRACPEQALS